MKKVRLTLHTETLRTLNESSLASVGGGTFLTLTNCHLCKPLPPPPHTEV